MSRAKSKRIKDLERKKTHDLLKEQRHLAKTYIFETSFKDKLIQEIVEVETPEKVDAYLKTVLTPENPQVYYACNEGWQDGLVLISALQFSIYQKMLETPNGRDIVSPDVFNDEF